MSAVDQTFETPLPPTPYSLALSSLRLRLRALVLHLRLENTHLLSVLSENSNGDSDWIHVDDLLAILLALRLASPSGDPPPPAGSGGGSPGSTGGTTPASPPATAKSPPGRNSLDDRAILLRRFGNFRELVAYRKLYGYLDLEPPAGEQGGGGGGQRGRGRDEDGKRRPRLL